MVTTNLGDLAQANTVIGFDDRLPVSIIGNAVGSFNVTTLNHSILS